jgi:two-component system response regulator HydG
VPPLRARGSDVLLLAQHFLKRFAAGADKRVVGFSSAAAERLLSYSWPGNVRELQNCVERAVALARFDTIGVDDLPETVRETKPSPSMVVESEDPSELLPMEEVERRYILRVLEAVGGSKKLAARILGLDRRTLYRKLERYAAQAEGQPPRRARKEDEGEPGTGESLSDEEAARVIDGQEEPDQDGAHDSFSGSADPLPE